MLTVTPTCSWSESSPVRRSRPQVSGWSPSAADTAPSTATNHRAPTSDPVVDGTLYHPGEALDVPEEDVETLLVPIQGAWIKTSEALDFVHAVARHPSVGIHDAQVNERGLGALNRWMAREASTAYRWMQPGTFTPI